MVDKIESKKSQLKIVYFTYTWISYTPSVPFIGVVYKNYGY